MPKIGVVGAHGFLGSALIRACVSAGLDVMGITRDSYIDDSEKEFDILINCAMPSARFWAKQNPRLDFEETVIKTANLMYGWKYKKFIQISTVSARCQLDTVYGRHKRAAEVLCETGENLTIRLGALYSENVKKGVLVDMKQNKKVFVDGASRYCFADVDIIAKWIIMHFECTGIIEAGGRNAISLYDVAKHIGSVSEFEGIVDHQEVQNPADDLPEASDVLIFLDKWKISN